MVSVKKVEIFQKYSIDNIERSSFNEEIEFNQFKIDISLNSLMSRKNMAFGEIKKRLNEHFLLEFLCVILQEQGLWDEKLCNNSQNCSIQKAISMIKMLL